MKKPIVYLILALLILGNGCCDRTNDVAEEKDFFPTEADDEDLIALTSQELNLIYIKEGYREQVAEQLMIEDPSANRWTMMLGANQQDTVMLEAVTVPTIRLRASSHKIGDRGIFRARKCTGNRAAEEGQCIRRPGNVNFWYRRDIVGYSYCQRSNNPDDVCDVVYVNTGVWVFFSDRCQTISRRSNWHRARWICIP